MASVGHPDRRSLAHRGSRLAVVHASEPAVLRVLAGAGIHLPSAPPREPRPARPWPEWAELVPGVIWIYDFTHFTRAKRCAVAVLDVVSRYWLAAVVSGRVLHPGGGRLHPGANRRRQGAAA